MNTKSAKRKARPTVPKMIRFPNDLAEWLVKRARSQGIRSEAELVRQVMHDYRQRVENTSAA